MSVGFNAGSVTPEYSRDKWYEYVINTFIADTNKLKEVFPDNQSISAEDVIKYVVTSDYGAKYLIMMLQSIAIIYMNHIFNGLIQI